MEKKTGILSAEPDLSGVEEELVETNDLNLIENVAIFSTIYEKIVKQNQLPIFNDDMIELELVRLIQWQKPDKKSLPFSDKTV